MPENQENPRAVTVYLYELDVEIVQEEAGLDGSNFSAALRKIIRRDARNYRPMPPETEQANA